MKNYSKPACNETCPDRVRKHLSEHESPKLYKLYYLVINHSFLTIEKAERDKECKERWQRGEKHGNMVSFSQA